jgi:dephospho-CoA kinase
MTRRRHVIGLTGNIATGKSTVLGMLAELGAETLDADEIVHAMMGLGSALAPALSTAFGAEVVNADGSINRPLLGRIVFANPERFEELERLIHPAVVEGMLAAIHAPGPTVLVLDAIKLFEAGIARHCDVVWVVDADRETRIARVMARNRLDREEAERRVDAQPPQEEKLARADVVIDNGGSLDGTRRQVEAAWAELVGD